MAGVGHLLVVERNRGEMNVLHGVLRLGSDLELGQGEVDVLHGALMSLQLAKLPVGLTGDEVQVDTPDAVDDLAEALGLGETALLIRDELVRGAEDTEPKGFEDLEGVFRRHAESSQRNY